MFCIHNYIVGGCQVGGPSCPQASVDERVARWNTIHGSGA